MSTPRNPTPIFLLLFAACCCMLHAPSELTGKKKGREAEPRGEKLETHKKHKETNRPFRVSSRVDPR